MYIEYHIENHRVGLTHKFFFRSQEIGLPSPGANMFGFEHPDAPPGFYTVSLSLPDHLAPLRWQLCLEAWAGPVNVKAMTVEPVTVAGSRGAVR